MSVYINNKRMIPSEFMEFEEVECPDEALGFADSIEGLADSETKD